MSIEIIVAETKNRGWVRLSPDNWGQFVIFCNTCDDVILRNHAVADFDETDEKPFFMICDYHRIDQQTSFHGVVPTSHTKPLNYPKKAVIYRSSMSNVFGAYGMTKYEINRKVEYPEAQRPKPNYTRFTETSFMKVYMPLAVVEYKVTALRDVRNYPIDFV